MQCISGRELILWHGIDLKLFLAFCTWCVNSIDVTPFSALYEIVHFLSDFVSRLRSLYLTVEILFIFLLSRGSNQCVFPAHSYVNPCAIVSICQLCVSLYDIRSFHVHRSQFVCTCLDLYALMSIRVIVSESACVCLHQNLYALVSIHAQFFRPAGTCLVNLSESACTYDSVYALTHLDLSVSSGWSRKAAHIHRPLFTNFDPF